MYTIHYSQIPASKRQHSTGSNAANTADGTIITNITFQALVAHQLKLQKGCPYFRNLTPAAAVKVPRQAPRPSCYHVTCHKSPYNTACIHDLKKNNSFGNAKKQSKIQNHKTPPVDEERCIHPWCIRKRNANPRNDSCFGLPDNIKESKMSHYRHAENWKKYYEAERKANEPAIWIQQLTGCAIKRTYYKKVCPHSGCYDVQNGNCYWEEDKPGSEILKEWRKGFFSLLCSIAFELVSLVCLVAKMLWKIASNKVLHMCILWILSSILDILWRLACSLSRGIYYFYRRLDCVIRINLRLHGITWCSVKSSIKNGLVALSNQTWLIFPAIFYGMWTYVDWDVSIKELLALYNAQELLLMIPQDATAAFVLEPAMNAVEFAYMRTHINYTYIQ